MSPFRNASVQAKVVCRTDKWFSTYLKKTHNLLETTTVGKPRVRIAILDTGLNKKHPQVKQILEAPNDEKRIKKCRSWVPGVVGTDITDKKGILLADEDIDGHGTHCAMVAHKVAPDADIYVARIFRDRKSVCGDYVIKVSFCLMTLITILITSAGYQLGIGK